MIPIRTLQFNMGFVSHISVGLLLICCFSLIGAQQPYVGKDTTACTITDVSKSDLGYFYNGPNSSCQAYLSFRSQPLYNTTASISDLLSADPSQVSVINEVSETETLETDKLVLVPINCSRSGQFYQANTSYVVKSGDTIFFIANNTFQGLSTCQAIQNQSSSQTTAIFPGQRINVPLRCACPTKNQTDVGIRYLLSYLVTWGENVSTISLRFGVDTGRTLEANQLSSQNAGIYPFTTLLVPLDNPPTAVQTIAPPPPPNSPPPPSTSPPSGNGSGKTWVYVLVGILGGGALISVAGAIIFCLFFRKSKKSPDPIIVSQSFEAYEKLTEKKLEEESLDFLESVSSIAQFLKVYKYAELLSATDNFSPSCRIKGSVYRGNFNGDFAAVKKMNGDVSNEIKLLSTINHSNLIRLSGVCFNDGHWYLVYEYAVNGPLSDWIDNSNTDGKFLSWTQRMQIALDVATGLNYLHSFTSPPHVHKDIKSSNVLLDGDFRAKVANFALARSTEGQEGEFALTRHIVGTKGYMAPEYLENGLVSTKLDVYAFGVLMLEILTGKEAAGLYEAEKMNLSDVLNEENGQEGLRHFIDPSMQGNYPPDLVIFMIRLIDCCLKKDPMARPDMDEIVHSLSRILTSSHTSDRSKNFSGYKT